MTKLLLPFSLVLLTSSLLGESATWAQADSAPVSVARPPKVPPALPAPAQPTSGAVVLPAELEPPPAAVAVPPEPPAADLRPIVPLLQQVPTHEVPPPGGQQRGTGIALIVVGNIIQFVGVSMLFPAVVHSLWGSNTTTFPVVPFGAAGGSLVGVGNVVEITGWVLFKKNKRQEVHVNRYRDLDDR